MVDIILVVDSDEQTQLQRTMTRDNSSEQQVKAIMAAQVSRENRLACADDIIKNIGLINGLTNDVQKMHDKYLRLARKTRS